MIKMGQILHMDIVAEGVETLDELEFLRENQCYRVQGYLFRGPCLVEEFEKNFEKFHE